MTISPVSNTEISREAMAGMLIALPPPHLPWPHACRAPQRAKSADLAWCEGGCLMGTSGKS
jgi:hypothetical protein